MLNSQIYASGNTISVSQGGAFNQALVRAAHSSLGGGAALAAPSGIVKRAAVTDENYDFFANTCP
ncbi:MAG TPA: hypothetical protein VD861_14685 [Pyrinomonadaceae bacterium]|nr:hypothetical protein [Pyrinomonadaceae bacterium]